VEEFFDALPGFRIHGEMVDVVYTMHWEFRKGGELLLKFTCRSADYPPKTPKDLRIVSPTQCVNPWAFSGSNPLVSLQNQVSDKAVFRPLTVIVL
jgi:hypothetical protein